MSQNKPTPVIPENWVKQSGDFHVNVFIDNEPNCLIFAPTHSTLSLLDECVYSATLAGRKLMTDGVCSVFEVKYCYGDSATTWPFIKLKWEDENE